MQQCNPILHNNNGKKNPQTTANVSKDIGKKEPSYIIGGNANLYKYYGRQYGGISKS
jgi:hypothetical protein